jgi:hypothetical protein
MIGHKLPNKTKSGTVAEPKKFYQLNMPSDKVGNEKLLTKVHYEMCHETLTWLDPKLQSLSTMALRGAIFDRKPLL